MQASTRRHVAGLVALLLLLSPGSWPAPGRAPSGSGGVMLATGIELRDVSAALNNLRWGANGQFAGFMGLSLASKDCSYVFNPNSGMYRNQSEYNAVMATALGQDVKRKQDVRDALSLAYVSVTGVLSLIEFFFVLGNSIMTVHASMLCQSELNEKNAQLGPRPQAPQVAAVVEGEIKLSLRIRLRKVYYTVSRAYDRFSRRPAGLILVPIKSAINSFLKPIKQVGALLELVGRGFGWPSATKAGKALRTFSTKPQKTLSDVYQGVSAACDEAKDNAEQFRKVSDIVSLISEAFGLVNTLGVIPYSYVVCSQQEQEIAQAIDQVRSATASGSSSGKRRRALLAEPGVKTVADILQQTEDAHRVAAAFLDSGFAKAVKAVEDVNLELMVTASETFATVLEEGEKIAAKIDEASQYFDVQPPELMFSLQSISSLLSKLPEPCPEGSGDIICSMLQQVGDLIDRVLDGIFRAVGIKPDDFEIAFRQLFSLKAPIPPFFFDANLIPVSFPSWDVSVIFGWMSSFEDQVQQMINNLEADVRRLLQTLLGISAGTTTYDYEESSEAEIRRRSSVTAGDVIDVRCPTGWFVYGIKFSLTQPGCAADYTAWTRFPCNTSSCSFNWTAWNWKCPDAPPAQPFDLPSRRVSFEYDCVSPAALASYKLLPELVSATKTGSTDLPATTFVANEHLPTARALLAFSNGLGNNNDFSLPELDNIYQPALRPGVRSKRPGLTDTPRAAPPFEALSTGRLNFDLLNPFYERAGALPVTVSCANAAAFGLPELLIEGVDVDACYDTVFWQNQIAVNPDTTLYNSLGFSKYRRLPQRDFELLRSDYCGWRQLAKLGFRPGRDALVNATLLSMTPKMLMPWPKAPSDSEFEEFWLKRSVCEFFDGGSRTARSHLSFSDWMVSQPPTAAACKAAIADPSCNRRSSTQPTEIICDTATQGADWPLIGPVNDPNLNNLSLPASVCGMSVPSDSNYYPCLGSAAAVTTNAWCGLRAIDSSTPAARVYSSKFGSEYLSQLTFFFGNSSVAPPGVQNVRTTPAQQWASECSLEFVRRVEHIIREIIHGTYIQHSSTLEARCQAMLDACQGTRGSCPLSELFRCSAILGVVQFACTPASAPAANGSTTTTTYVFANSLMTQKKRVGCGTGGQLLFTSAELGVGRSIRDVMVEVVQSMCQSDGSSCLLDVSHSVLNAPANAVLRVVSTCVCREGFDSLPVNGSCVPCGPGFYRNISQATCTLMPPGYASNDTTAAAPTPCPPGSYAAGEGNTNCTLCPAGHFSAAVAASDASTCQRCAGPNEYSGAGSAACSVCPPGFMVPFTFENSNGSANSTGLTPDLICTPCFPGSFRSSSLPKCTACAPGFYAVLPASTNCTAAGPGSFVSEPGAVAPQFCAPGFYQPLSGQTACIACPTGQSTPGLGSNSSAACVDTPVASVAQLTRLQQLAATPARCADLVAEMAKLSLSANATSLLAEVGDGSCNKDLRNSLACGYDGGDCCLSTCVRRCEQLDSAADNSSAPETYVVLARSCTPASFQCLDPAAQRSNTPPPFNCTGSLAPPPSLLQQLLAPVVAGVEPTVELVAAGIAATASANSSSNSSSGGLSGSCANSTDVLALAACLGTSADGIVAPSNTSGSRDTAAPVINPPPSFATACGATLQAPNLTAYDVVDGTILLAAPSIQVTPDTGVTVRLGGTLPCASSNYSVLLTWTAADGAGNAANASMTVAVIAQSSTGSSPAPGASPAPGSSPAPRASPAPGASPAPDNATAVLCRRAPPKLFDGTVPPSFAQARLNDIIRGVCNKGFAPAPNFTCTAKGWEPGFASCSKACTVLPPPAANISWPASCRDSTPIGAVCPGACPRGWFGRPWIVCTGDAVHLQWTYLVGRCSRTPVCLGFPKTPPNSAPWPTSVADAPVGTVVSAPCPAPFRRAPSATCLSTPDGPAWVTSTPFACRP